MYSTDSEHTELNTRVNSKGWKSLSNLSHLFDRVRRLARIRFSNRTVTLSVHDGVVRSVTIKGHQVVSWETKSLDEILPDEKIDQKQRLAKIGRLFQSLRKALCNLRERVVTDIPPDMPMTRRIQAPDVRRRYLQHLILSEVSETVPSTDESRNHLDVKWQAQRNETGYEVVATAVPRVALDAHVSMLKEHEISPNAAYSKAAALTLAANVNDAIIANFEGSHLEIVLVRERVPEIVYRIDLPFSHKDLEELSETVARAINRVVDYHHTLAITEEDSPLPVILTGQVNESERVMIARFVRKLCEREVLSFSTDFVCPQGFPVSEYAVNLGLALADKAGIKTGSQFSGQPHPQINLLSKRHFTRPVPFAAITVFSGLLLLSAASIGITPRVNSATAEVVELSDRLKATHSEIRQQRITRTRVDRLLGQKETLEQQITALSVHQDSVNKEADVLLTGIEALTDKGNSFGIKLSNIDLKAGGFELVGNATSYESVVRYLDDVQSSDLFKAVNIRDIQASGDSKYLFRAAILNNQNYSTAR